MSTDHHTHTIVCEDPSLAADLRIEKSVDNHHPEIGDTVTWTLSIKNDGPGHAAGVRVEDLLPPGVYHVSDTADFGDYDENTGEWYIGNFASGSCHTLTIETVVTDLTAAQINSATVYAGADTHESDYDNNTDSDWISPQGSVADLNVVKGVSNDQPAIGDEVTWSVTVTNDGPDTATNVVVKDELPPGVTHISDQATAGDYDEAAGTWRFDELASGASQTLTIVTSVQETSPQWNNATANSDTYEADWSDNTGHAVVRGGEADISITKTVSDEAPNLGDEVEWTITVTNNSTDTAIGVKVLDTLPSGLKHVGDEATTGYFDEYQSQWWIGELEGGASETLTITTNVIDAAETQVNTSTVLSDTSDPDTENNTATASTNAESADLVVEKSVSDAAPNVGDTITWTVTVRNDGADTAVNTVLHDALPNGVEYASNDASLGGYDNITGQWDLGDLPAGASETLTIDTVVTASFLQMNVAVITSDTFDPEDCNNHDFAIVDALPAADLAVTKVVSDEAPNLGDVITWTIEVTNNGPDTATNIEINEVLPAGVTFLPDADGNERSAGAYNPAEGSWTLSSLAVGATETLVLSTTVTSLDEQVNAADVTSDTYDHNPDNNSDNAVTDAVASDLQVTKVVSDETPNLGDVITWTIEVTNNGPDAAIGVEVTDILPAGVTLIPLEFGRAGSAGSYEDGSWTLDTLAVGATETLTLSTEVTSLDVQVNTATVTSSTIDLDPTNNDDTAEADAVAADLQVTKVVSDEAPNLGDVITWTIEVTNNGPDAATGVEVTDILPAGVTLIPVDADLAASAGSYENGSWTLSTLAVGATETLTLSTEVTSLDVQVNTATVTSSTIDLDPTNNDDSAETDAVAADLQVTKVVSDEAPNIGDVISWTIEVTNKGPDAANDIEVTDILPAGVTLIAAASGSAASAGSYENGSWTLSTLAVGATETLTLSTEVTSLDVQINSATVTSSTIDLDPTNNDDTAETDPVAADLAITKVVSDESPSLGDMITWTVEVVNNGPDSATEVTVLDALPDGLVYVNDSATTATGTVTVTEDGAIGWQIGDLGVSNPVTLEIVTEVISLDIQVNEATVTAAPGEDQDPINNTAEAEVDAIQVDLSVTNMTDTQVASIGDSVVWEVTVTNEGPDDATGVAVSDVLPEGIVFVSADTDTASATYTDGVLEVGDLAVGETVSVTITSTVSEEATVGNLISIAQVIRQQESDLDSAPDNDDGDQSEDDEAAASITIEPAFGAVANDLAVDGSGGGSINAVVVIDRSSSMKENITIDGVTKTRLDWNIEAVEDFAARTEIKSVKVIAFDARVTDDDGSELPIIYDGGDADLIDKNHVPTDEVSDWIDLSTAAGATALEVFLADLGPEGAAKPWGSGTNYQAAIDATMAQDLESPVDAVETNYYFFSDGVPTQGGNADNQLEDVAGWESFAEANFDNTYAVGFGGAIKAREALEEIAHINGQADDPTIDDDPNLLLVTEIDAVPSVLSNFASTSVTGNAIADDISENAISITSMVFDGVTYTYAGGEITESGPTQDAFLTNSFVVVESDQEGSLQFDFETGDFTYFSPTTAVDITEVFEYSIMDTEGMESSADVTINVAAFPALAATEVVEIAFADLVSANDDDLDQLLPTSPAVAKLPSADGELSVVEDHGGSDVHLSQLDLEMQIWDSGVAMF